MPPNEPRVTPAERERQRREREWSDIAYDALTFGGVSADDAAATLLRASDALELKAEMISEIKRAGWKATAAETRNAARHLRELAEMVKLKVPPSNLPEPTPITGPVDSKRPGSGSVAELEARLVDSFGANLSSGLYDVPVTPAVAADLRKRIESEVDGQPPADLICSAVLGVGDDENCRLPFGHAGNHSLEPAPPACTMGPACPVHPGIEVLHPADAPIDAVIGPEGGSERLPRDEEPPVPDVMPPFQVERLHTPNRSVMMPAFTDAGPSPAARPRLTYASLYQHVAQRPPSDHRSVSQISTAADCGVKFALYGEPEQAPAWWNVAGTALHTCIENYEIREMGNEHAESVAWLPTFYAAIETERQATGVDVGKWRAARGGSEGYDWWRVQGETFLSTYVAWSQKRHADGWHILTIGDTPVIEYPFALDVHGIRLDGFIDQAWSLATDYDGRPVGKIEIIDMKFGSSKPGDRFQLGVYAHALASMHAGGSLDPLLPIGGAYYLGRKGELHGHAEDLRRVIPWDDVLHRTMMAESMARAGLYMPRRSSFCGACGVADLCPAGAS